MKRGLTFIELLVLFAIAAVLAAILFPVFMRIRENKEPRYSSCQRNLKNIGLGFLQYLQDYNEKFPLVASGGATFGWVDALGPYVKSNQIYHCPSDPNDQGGNAKPRSRGYTDYWMNARLANREQGQLVSPSFTILDGDGDDGQESTNARYSVSSIPRAWFGKSSSPLYRHLEGANYGFTDGHVKWYRAEKMAVLNPNASPKAGNPTFALK